MSMIYWAKEQAMTVTDEIDIYRVMKRAGRKRADMAKAVAPLVQAAYAAGLERAAVILEEDAKLCDCFARAEGECACGAWDDYKTAPIERMVDLIRAEKDKT